MPRKLAQVIDDEATVPELRQFGDLYPEDFDRHPVWIQCHVVDYNEPWYADTDEETFRPWTGELPVAFLEEVLLVRADFKLPDGSIYPGFVTPAIEGLSKQQPQMFVGNRRFSFWGGVIGVSEEAEQELSAALGKTPDAIFPLRFSADPGLVSCVVTGEVSASYANTGNNVPSKRAERPDDRLHHHSGSRRSFSRILARSSQGYPQPEDGYKLATYGDVCLRCGIYERQVAPFRFKKARSSMRPDFLQLNWVFDALFAHPDIAAEIIKLGLTGVSFGPVLDYRTGAELTDRVQILIPTIIPCAETSRLPAVTCRPDNEEEASLRAGGYEGYVLKAREVLAGVPYCGRIKYHAPDSLVINPESLGSPPDLFQTAEWFGSGGLAYRLTIASDRFATLLRERGWKGLVFRTVNRSGYSVRTSR